MQATALPAKAQLRPATILTALATIVTLVVVALALANTGEASSSLAALGPAEAGSLVALEMGNELAVSLPGNPTTGYTWAVISMDEAILTQIGEAEFVPESNLIGAAGTMILRFEGSGTGETLLELGYLRTWEDAEPLDTYQVTIRVR
jgi:inhibitor of cysteine peptidase